MKRERKREKVENVKDARGKEAKTKMNACASLSLSFARSSGGALFLSAFSSPLVT